MNCIGCNGSANDWGGTLMEGCGHFLCTKCLTKAAKRTTSKGIKCGASSDMYKCNGRIKHEDLQSMLPEKVYKKYIERTKNATQGNKQQQDLLRMTVNDLDLSLEEKETGWAHKAVLIDEFVRLEGLTHEAALQRVDNLPIIWTRGPIKCSMCADKIIPEGGGVVLKDCLHMFCKKCIKMHISKTNTPRVKCPYKEPGYKCGEPLTESEVMALADGLEFEPHFRALSMKDAAGPTEHIFQCLTPNCQWFCVTDGTVVTVTCEICKAQNCITCNAIHDGICPLLEEIFPEHLEEDYDDGFESLNDFDVMADDPVVNPENENGINPNKNLVVNEQDQIDDEEPLPENQEIVDDNLVDEKNVEDADKIAVDATVEPMDNATAVPPPNAREENKDVLHDDHDETKNIPKPQPEIKNVIVDAKNGNTGIKKISLEDRNRMAIAQKDIEDVEPKVFNIEPNANAGDKNGIPNQPNIADTKVNKEQGHITANGPNENKPAEHSTRINIDARGLKVEVGGILNLKP